MTPEQIVAHELLLIRLVWLKRRLDERERFQREAVETARAPQPGDELEHAKLQSYRAGMADAYAYASKYTEQERVEIARTLRAQELG